MKKHPIVFSILSDIETPISLFAKIAEQEPHAFLLESTDSDSRLARFSFLGVAPILSFQFKNGQGSLLDHRTQTAQSITINNPLTVLEECLMREGLNFQPPQDDSLPFTGGWVGYMGYGTTYYFDRIPQQAEDPQDVPDGYYGLYDTVIAFDHLRRRISLVTYKSAAEAQDMWKSLLVRLGSLLSAPTKQGLSPSSLASPSLAPIHYEPEAVHDNQIFDSVQSRFDREAFCELVRQGKELIQEGQIFQIVISHRFTLPVSAAPLLMYRMIQAVNPSPYAYFLKFPEFTYFGSSPETFVRCHQGEVILRALAGTRPRGATPEEDLMLERELRSNEKEMAEHRMLVDLGRNDLGRICRVKTIEVGEIATLTRYTNVMHLATEIKGQLRPDKTMFQVFQSCFPRGTVTGAPKIRAMQLLSRIEPERRGVYSGVVGYFDFFGNMDAAIAIRSALVKGNIAHVNAGAGVVYDSLPEAEYEETRNKAKSILKAILLAERAHLLDVQGITPLPALNQHDDKGPPWPASACDANAASSLTHTLKIEKSQEREVKA